jgi:cell division protein FtsI (penicillin-binding protein 3)
MTATDPSDDNPCRPRHFKPTLCAPAPTEGPGRAAIEIGQTRLVVAAGLFALAFLAIATKLVFVMAIEPGDLRTARPMLVERTAPARADITDRNGVLLATTLELPSLYANPKLIWHPRKIAGDLHRILPDMAADALFDALTKPSRSFVWIHHDLTPRQEVEINDLGEPGLQFLTEERRVYPKGNLAAHVVGFVNDTGKGIAGIEAGLDERLRAGGPVALSLDTRIQFILREAVQSQMDQFTAKHGVGIVMDVRNGEVLALSSLPDFDPNDLANAAPEELYNYATYGIYEMGSVFKIFNTAMVLESGVANLDTRFDATSPIQVGRFTIHDDHPEKRWLSVAEVFEYSSNIGSAKMALAAGIDRQENFLERLGLLSAPTFELPETRTPQIPQPWREVSAMTVAYGHGISVSPLQVASAVAAVVNGGTLYPATLVPHAHPTKGKRVLSPAISEEMRRLLRLVVTGGTGKLAEAPGYVVGGKTGTAEKADGRHYDHHELLSSFIGVFPINDPRYLVLVSIDEPHGNHASSGLATGGWVAAPGVSRVIERMAPLVGIHPEDEDSPEIRRALMIDMPVPEGRKLAVE